MKRSRIMVLLGVITIVVIGAAGWYLGSPLFLNRTVQEDLPFDLPEQSELEEMPDPDQQDLADQANPTASAMPDDQMEEPMPVDEEPTILSQGEFQGVDNFHQGSGRATIFELADGDRLLRFENFMVTNGPGLVVLLAAGDAPLEREDLGTYLSLGPLKGNIGDQNYEITEGTELGLYRSVVIYCEPFHVVFATAGLTDSNPN